MREIKFRAWDKKGNNFIDIWSLKLKGDDTIKSITDTDDRIIYEDDFILMQYTGLKDKNGKEIYEGDILEFTDKWEWYRSSYGIKMNFAGPSELKELQEKYAAEPMHRREVKFDPLEGYGLSKGDLEGYFEIIGNIYENPELLT